MPRRAGPVGGPFWGAGHMRATKKVGVLGAAVVLVGVLVACQPSFPSSSTLTIEALGPLAKITWPTLSTDSDKWVSQYRIDIDGADVGIRVPSSVHTCVVVGLALSHTATITVTG